MRDITKLRGYPRSNVKTRLEQNKINFIHIAIYFFIIIETGRKTLKLGVLPSINLPAKSHETPKTEARRHLNIVGNYVEVSENKPSYRSWQELCSRTGKLKLLEWSFGVDNEQENAHLKYFVSPFTVPKYEIIVNNSLEYTVVVFGWRLPDDSDTVRCQTSF